MTPSRSPRRRRLLIPALVAFLTAFVFGVGVRNCGRKGTDSGPTVEDVLARDRAAAFFVEDQNEGARRELAPLVERADALVEDLLRAANVELALGQIDAARPLVERARESAPDDPGVRWAFYRVARDSADFEGALPHVARVHELAPNDIPAHLALANLLAELDRMEEAEGHYTELLALGPDVAGSWYVTTLFRYAALLRRTGRADQAAERLTEWRRLEEVLGSPQQQDIDRGGFGGVPPATVTAFDLPAPEAPAAPRERARFALDAGTTGTALVHVERGAMTEKVEGLTRPIESAPPALLAWGAAGLALWKRADGAWSAARLSEGPVHAAELLVLRPEPDDEVEFERVWIAFATGSELRFLERAEGAWRPAGEPVPLGGTARALLATDFDHEGDLDLLASVDGTPRLLRNDGVGVEGGGFVDATDGAGLPAHAGIPLSEDVDGDNDVDYLFLGEGAPAVASNERKGRFSEGAGLPRASAVGAADLDRDGRTDLLLADPLRLAVRTPGLGFADPRELTLTNDPAGPPLVLDWDQDGTADVLVPGRRRAVGGVLSAGEAKHLAFEWELAADGGDARLLVGDLDGDRDPDLLRVGADGTVVEFERPGPGAGLVLELLGGKDNPRGVGAIVEVRAGKTYRRLYWRGGVELLGLGSAAQADVVRITWPNGVVQNVLDLAAGAWRIKQREGLVGSCPFLYAWNGTTYGFVSDVLGITPLGLPMAPGVLVPPDHDEYVLVEGEGLVPRDGFYEVQFTEELREVTYLDRIRLDVVDHPEGTEVFPNERFTFPPFPEPVVHAVRGPLAPARALGSDGADWTEALAADDGALAFPFVPYRGQFLGLCDPHFLELSFDPERTRGAERLRLLLNGWFYWTDASVNVASAGHPGAEFVPPLLQVPDGEGGWRTAGPPLGFPAGKLKTMVVDVTEYLDPEDPRLRVFTTLRLYWDSIRLAVDAEDAPMTITSLEPTSASLWERGFSEPVPLHGEHALDWFEWDRLSEEPRWDQHPGLYTKLGETLPLVTAIDDRFVVMGSGDALTVRFDASAAPPLRAGWRRDFLVFLDGWAKDRDPNTHEALYVEPLPFHGMSGYPYGPDEAFPDDEVHRAWRAEWLTRPARRWIAPLVPRRP